MNKIVRENYPVSKLPEDLREPFAPGATVVVTVEDGPVLPDRPLTLEEIFALARPVFKSAAEVNEYVRAMREDSEDEA